MDYINSISTVDLTERETQWVFNYFLYNNWIAQVDNQARGQARIQLVEDTINRMEDDTRSGFINQTLAEIKKQILLDEEFNWVDVRNDRLCYFTWFYVLKRFGTYTTSLSAYPHQIPPLANSHIQNQSTEQLNQQPSLFFIPQWSPSNSQERKKWLFEFFDKSSTVVEQEKYSIMKSIKDSWALTFNNQKLHQWIDKENELQIYWLWSYLPKELFDYRQQPINIKEQYLAIVGMLDFWTDEITKIKYHLDKAKRAWSQKKHRENRGERISCNFVLSFDAKKTLDEIAEHKDKKLSEMIEYLIFEEKKKLVTS